MSIPGLGGRDSEPVWIIYRSKLDEIAGRPVTNEETARIGKALEFSTIPEALEDVVISVTGYPPEEEGS